MTIVVDWADFEETVIICQLRGNWMGDDFYQARTECFRLVRERNKMTTVIIDLNYSRRSPKNILPMSRAFLEHCPPYVEKLVILSSTSFWHRIFEMARLVTKFDRPVCYAQSIDEAYAYAGVD